MTITNAKMKRDEETDSGYENKARRIAREMGLLVVAAYKGDRCPPWSGKDRCDHMHGDRYRVTVKRAELWAIREARAEGKTLSVTFDFWNSRHDADKGKEPGYYDVLCCIASDATSPTDPDEVVEEYGEMKPSQAIAAAAFATRLQAFLTASEVAKLGEIDR